MAVYDHSELEQLENIKSWWHQYGNRIINTALAIMLVVVSVMGWNWYQRNQAAKASDLYFALQQAVASGQQKRIKIINGELIAKYSGTTQAILGAMTAARVSHESGDLKTAKVQLAWAVENAEGELRDVARLNYAAVLMDDKAYNEALHELEAEHGKGFEANFAQLRGDILLSSGKKEEARDAYKSALVAMGASYARAELEGSGDNEGVEVGSTTGQTGAGNQQNSNDGEHVNSPARELLQQKLNALGGS